MAIAEYYFSHNLLHAARVNYLKVLKTSAVELYPRVLYALGHIYVARGDYDKAHQAFERFRTEFPKESSLACRAAGDVLACGYLGFVASGLKQPKTRTKHRNSTGGLFNMEVMVLLWFLHWDVRQDSQGLFIATAMGNHRRSE